MARPSGVSGALLVVIVVALAVLALRPSKEEIFVDGSPPIEAPTDGTAVINGLRASGGLALFGLQMIDPTHTIEIQFLTGPDCSSQITSGDAWPTSLPECSSRVDVMGTVGGLGITGSGRSLVGVVFPVSRECFERLERGMPWPPDVPACEGQ